MINSMEGYALSKKIMSLMLLGVLILSLSLAGCGQKAAESKILRVGSEASFAPFEFQEEGSKEYAGFDMDLIRAIGKQMGYEVQIQNMGFDGLIPALDASAIDVAISGMTITEERGKKISFSAPYYKAGLTVVVRSDDTTIKSFKDLDGKKIAVQLGTTSADEAKKINNGQIREFNSAPESFLELKAGGVDAVINDKPVNDYYIAKAGGKDAKVVGEPLTSEEYGMAMAKKNTELVEKVNKALEELKKNGEYEKLYVKWFGKKP